MRRLIFGLLVLVAVATASVIKYDQHFPAQDVQFSSHHVVARSIHVEPQDFAYIKERFHALNHNIVKRSPGWKSKGSSKSKGSGSGFFSSKAKGNNKAQDHNSGYNNNHNGNKHSSAPQQPAYNPAYGGHPAPAYGGHPAPAYGGHPAPAYGGHPAPAYGAQPAYHPQPGYNPGYGHPAAPAYGQPAYHAPQPQQPTVVVVGGGGSGGGGGYQPAMKGPGLGSAIATGLAQGAGSGIGFGVANAAINGITGGGSRHSEPRPYQPQNNDGNTGSSSSNNNNNNNNNHNNDNFNAQANPECLKTCFSTDEYAPVCGTDSWEYTNIGKLNCMKTCGKRVEVARYGNCYIPPPPGYGVNGTPAVGGANAVPPPPPNSPVVDSSTIHFPSDSTTPVSSSTGGLPPGIESPTGLVTGVPVGSASTLTPPSSTTVSPEYTACLEACDVTAEFNPQCGTDGQQYSNPGRVKCAQGCGRVVDIAFSGPCAKTTGQPSTTAKSI